MSADITACWVGVVLNKEERTLHFIGAAGTRAELIELMDDVPAKLRFTFALSSGSDMLVKRMHSWLSRNGIADEAIKDVVAEVGTFLMDVLQRIKSEEQKL
jgi:hypothetical protein